MAPRMKLLSLEFLMLVLSMGELLSCTASLVFSWQMLRVNPTWDNLPAVLGYISSVLGTSSAAAALYGVSGAKSSWLLLHYVLNTVTMALTIPTVSVHAYVLAAAADDTANDVAVDELTLKMARQMAWRIGTQIVLFVTLMMMMFSTNLMSVQLRGRLEKDRLLRNRLKHYVTTEHWKTGEWMYQEHIQKRPQNSIIIRL